MNVIDDFLDQARRVPDRAALITAAGEVSFQELDRQSNALAHHFQEQGLKAGDIVFVLQGVGIPLYATLLALFRMGAVAMFPDVSTKLSAMDRYCSMVNVRGFSGQWKARILKMLLPGMRAIPLTLGMQVPEASYMRILADVPGDHPALMTFTSGSTGQPKGVVRSHGFLLSQHKMVSRMLCPEEGDVDLISLPVFVLSNLASGATSVIPAGDLRRPGTLNPVPVLKQIERYGVNRILAPPAFLQQLVKAGVLLQQIKKIFTGGGPVFPDLLQSLAAIAPGAEITAVYGSTEAEPIAHIAMSELSADDLMEMKSGGGLLAGVPSDGVGLKIVDDEILVTGDHVIKGYLDSADNISTKVLIGSEIWHRTGDAGRLDEKGRLWLLGRREARQDSIYPFCIETAARATGKIRQAAFLHHRGRNILAVVSHDRQFDFSGLKGRFGNFDVIDLKNIPLDRRHNSKIDYAQLRRILDKEL